MFSRGTYHHHCRHHHHHVAESPPTGKATQILHGDTRQVLRSRALGFRPFAAQPRQVRLPSLGLSLGNGNGDPPPVPRSFGELGCLRPGRTVICFTSVPWMGRKWAWLWAESAFGRGSNAGLIVPLLCNPGQATYPLCVSASPSVTGIETTLIPQGALGPLQLGEHSRQPPRGVWSGTAPVVQSRQSPQMVPRRNIPCPRQLGSGWPHGVRPERRGLPHGPWGFFPAGSQGCAGPSHSPDLSPQTQELRMTFTCYRIGGPHRA